MMRALALSALVGLGDAHGAVTHPKPRNSIDGDLPPYSGKVRGLPTLLNRTR